MTVTVTHKCSHSREISVKGIKEARQYVRWLKQIVCPTCAGK